MTGKHHKMEQILIVKIVNSRTILIFTSAFIFQCSSGATTITKSSHTPAIHGIHLSNLNDRSDKYHHANALNLVILSKTLT